MGKLIKWILILGLLAGIGYFGLKIFKVDVNSLINQGKDKIESAKDEIEKFKDYKESLEKVKEKLPQQ